MNTWVFLVERPGGMWAFHCRLTGAPVTTKAVGFAFFRAWEIQRERADMLDHGSVSAVWWPHDRAKMC